MDAIELMMKEHENVRRITKVIRKLCIKIVNGEEIDYRVFYDIVDFIRNYTDRHHHKKEEEILFKKMSEKLGPMVAEGPVRGMLVEHDMGRLFTRNLEEAVKKIESGDMDARVDIIANAVSYANLLDGHTEKENNVLYKIAQRSLSKEDMEDVERQCMEAENLGEENGIQEKYTALVDRLERLV